MENASKALLIAGGVLMALLIISLGVVMMTNLSAAKKTEEQRKLAEQNAEFNLQFEVYDKKSLTGVDMISLCNKADDYNTRQSEDPNKAYTPITIAISLKVQVSGATQNIICKDQAEFLKLFKQDLDKYNLTSSDFKQFYYQCDKIEYDKNNGRIVKMEFSRVMKKT